MQTGYNMIYYLWKYSFDADCDLFLKILKGDVREDVYHAQLQLQVGCGIQGLWEVISCTLQQPGL